MYNKLIEGIREYTTTLDKITERQNQWDSTKPFIKGELYTIIAYFPEDSLSIIENDFEISLKFSDYNGDKLEIEGAVLSFIHHHSGLIKIYGKLPKLLSSQNDMILNINILEPNEINQEVIIDNFLTFLKEVISWKNGEY